jgi:hypothetical protein
MVSENGIGKNGNIIHFVEAAAFLNSGRDNNGRLLLSAPENLAHLVNLGVRQ